MPVLGYPVLSCLRQSLRSGFLDQKHV